MKRSDSRILTTHVGSLPRPDSLIPLLHAKDAGQPYDEQELRRAVAAAVAETVARQADLGIDVVNDGEQSKSGFATYHLTRLAGFSVREGVTNPRGPSRDEQAFPAVYAEQRVMYATRPIRTARRRGGPTLVCTGPVAYTGQNEVRTDIDNLQAAMRAVGSEEGFLTAISPTDLAEGNPNEYYRTQEEYATALADAMHEEYQAIVDAGFLLQIDDPALTGFYGNDGDGDRAEQRKRAGIYVEALNNALRGIPPDRVRFHTCYGINEGPRVYDVPLGELIELMLRINAQAYSFEAANARHEHEWRVFEEVKLPEGKILIPGVITHTSNIVEHPEVIADRIERFARVVGRENVIAGADCGFSSQASFTPDVHPTVVWAKFQALAEGAALASKRLGYRV
jgi:5-methyltetrahydropteroyltriglutamate--homocysteine methyltransferase